MIAKTGEKNVWGQDFTQNRSGKPMVPVRGGYSENNEVIEEVPVPSLTGSAKTSAGLGSTGSCSAVNVNRATVPLVSDWFRSCVNVRYLASVYALSGFQFIYLKLHAQIVIENSVSFMDCGPVAFCFENYSVKLDMVTKRLQRWHLLEDVDMDDISLQAFAESLREHAKTGQIEWWPAREEYR
ncbi:MAG TPA: hypothetical protein HPP97_09375 [Desulfuromonadales bacterium]|nr:hypothetical protein [Desulfuromonadales bacterium]